MHVSFLLTQFTSVISVGLQVWWPVNFSVVIPTNLNSGSSKHVGLTQLPTKTGPWPAFMPFKELTLLLFISLRAIFDSTVSHAVLFLYLSTFAYTLTQGSVSCSEILWVAFQSNLVLSHHATASQKTLLCSGRIRCNSSYLSVNHFNCF